VPALARDDALVSNKQAAVADLAPRRVHGHEDIESCWRKPATNVVVLTSRIGSRD
jgi:hypothetical protein